MLKSIVNVFLFFADQSLLSFIMILLRLFSSIVSNFNHFEKNKMKWLW